MPKTNGSGQATTLNPKQLDTLLDAAPTPEMRCIWSIQRYTGSRIQETLFLTWAAIHEERIVFIKSTTKTKQSREVLIDPRLRKEIDFYRTLWVAKYGRATTNREFCFPSRYGTYKPMTRQNADKVLREALINCGLPSGCSLHTFRRSLASQMHRKGVGVKVISKFTGHKSLSQLSEYIDIEQADEMKALAALH